MTSEYLETARRLARKLKRGMNENTRELATITEDLCTEVERLQRALDEYREVALEEEG